MPRIYDDIDLFLFNALHGSIKVSYKTDIYVRQRRRCRLPAEQI